MNFISRHPNATIKIGLTLAKKVKKGGILALVGDMGGGKTYFAKGFAKGLGLRTAINSPTFVLMKVYKLHRPGLKTFCHVDAYRLRRIDEIREIGLLEYLRRSDTVCIIEWADKLRPLLKGLPLTVVRFTYVSPTVRKISIQKRALWK
ncbi:MAG: tRNA (adenosine(37)-N6)-threonylcarbamoyltransferase complex ATPase subunit type 1 TsaE [Patescibacteria group bacterium]